MNTKFDILYNGESYGVLNILHEYGKYPLLFCFSYSTGEFKIISVTENDPNLKVKNKIRG